MRFLLHASLLVACITMVLPARAQTVVSKGVTPGDAKPVCAVDALVDSLALRRDLNESKPADTTTVVMVLRFAGGALKMATVPDTNTDKSLSQALLDLVAKHARQITTRTAFTARLRVKPGEEPQFTIDRTSVCPSVPKPPTSKH
jgi:hypothetical protein